MEFARMAAGVMAAAGILGCGAQGGDTPMPRVTHTIEVGSAPHGIRFSAAGDTAYVALSGDGQIAVIDLARMEVVRRIPAGETPLDLVATGAGHWLVTQFRDSTVLVLDGEGRIMERVVVGSGPSLFSPAGHEGRVYLTSEFADRLSVLDARSGALVRQHATGDRPYPADVARSGLAFVPSLDDGMLTVIDLASGETVAQLEVCREPAGGALAADQSAYIVACGGSNELAFVSTESFRVTNRVVRYVGPRPFSVAVTPDGHYGVAINAGGTTVTVIDPGRRAVLGVLQVGEQPIVARVHPDGRRIFVANEVSGTVSVIETPPPS